MRNENEQVKGIIENPEHATLDRAAQEKKTTLETYSEAIVENGLRYHESEHDKEGRDPKIYHTSEHPRTMKERAGRMAEIFHCTPEERAIIDMAIAWHDTVIEYDEADPNNLLAVIRRHRGVRESDNSPYGSSGNEAESARLLAEEMREANRKAGEEIFTEEQIQKAMWAIEATYPDVNFGSDFTGAVFEEYPYYEAASAQNPSLGRLLHEMKEAGRTKGFLFSQPHLEKALESGKPIPREVLLVALSDMGAAGLCEKGEFFKEGDAEMREIYENLRKPGVMERLMGGDADADKENRKKTRELFLRWLDSQTGFAAWQALRFEKIIYLLKRQNNLTEEEEKGLRGQFSHFEENICATEARAEEVKNKTAQFETATGEKNAFVYLARTMHYE